MLQKSKNKSEYLIQNVNKRCDSFNYLSTLFYPLGGPGLEYCFTFSFAEGIEWRAAAGHARSPLGRGRRRRSHIKIIAIFVQVMGGNFSIGHLRSVGRAQGYSSRHQNKSKVRWPRLEIQYDFWQANRFLNPKNSQRVHLKRMNSQNQTENRSTP